MSVEHYNRQAAVLENLETDAHSLAVELLRLSWQHSAAADAPAGGYRRRQARLSPELVRLLAELPEQLDQLGRLFPAPRRAR